ncbi:MAG: hypothetical protein ACLPLR_01720 [Terriglobales bacterium]
MGTGFKKPSNQPEALVQTLKNEGHLDNAVRQFVAESGYVYERYAMKVVLDGEGQAGRRVPCPSGTR